MPNDLPEHPWGADALAAIDLGSNSFRLEIARLRGGDYKTLLYRKEPVRLGAGLDAQGRLTPEAMQRGLDCLARFGAELRGFAPQRLRAVATQTLREAQNRDEFLVRAQEVLGFPVEVIAGREEARIIYRGVSRLQPDPATRLVIDIGGRSTELILGRGAEPLKAESFQVGSVGLSVRYFPDGRFTPEAFRAAQISAAAELEEAVGQFARGHAKPAWRQVLGSSGTVGAVAQLVAASKVAGGRINAESLRWCIDACLRAGSVDALELPGLKLDRKPVVAGGLCILYTLVCHFGIDTILPAKGALRQGLIFELAERLKLHQQAPSADLRERSVADLQQRFGVDLPQARQVRTLTERLFQQLLPRAPAERRLELGWTAAWHEIGQCVSHHDHHRHSAYLIGHLDAPGFSQSQQRRMATIALGQRGGLRKLGAEAVDETLRWQVMALRLAVIKAHAREPIDVKAMRLQREGTQVQLTMPKGWAATHPQTLFLLQEEVQHWSRSGWATLELRA
jgi:exopolyphosphatase/guanosine-5'-triphosphate,3'-diphosphate pyrophosphatase